MKKALKVCVNGALLAVLTITFGWALLAGIDKEIDRVEAVKQHHCKTHGQHMNKHYGREVCPPTPKG